MAGLAEDGGFPLIVDAEGHWHIRLSVRPRQPALRRSRPRQRPGSPVAGEDQASHRRPHPHHAKGVRKPFIPVIMPHRCHAAGRFQTSRFAFDEAPNVISAHSRSARHVQRCPSSEAGRSSSNNVPETCPSRRSRWSMPAWREAGSNRTACSFSRFMMRPRQLAFKPLLVRSSVVTRIPSTACFRIPGTIPGKAFTSLSLKIRRCARVALNSDDRAVLPFR